jgi:hypothetical protein
MKENTEYINLRREYQKQKLINEIICLSDQQAKHRLRLENGDTSKSIKKFIKVVNKMILVADKNLQKIIQEENKNDNNI